MKSLTYAMFSKEEASRSKAEFWTAFGKYMRPIPSADGEKINWVNYHTGLKDVYFRMDAGSKLATISITMEHRDTLMQELYFDQFVMLKRMLHTAVGETWEWQLHVSVQEDKVVSRIYKTLSDFSVFNKAHWPDLISFFKPRIIALDAFWSEAKYSFESLR